LKFGIRKRNDIDGDVINRVKLGTIAASNVLFVTVRLRLNKETLSKKRGAEWTE
jgi:hypothetical protein